MRNARGLDEDRRPRLLVVLGAAGQAIAVALVIAAGSVGGRDVGASPYLFAAGFGALLLLSRLSPVLVLALSLLGVFAYYIVDNPPIGMAVPVFGALFVAAERGRAVAAALAGALLLAVALYFRIEDGESSVLLAYDVITNAALIACAIALALTVRGRRHLREEQERVLLLERRAQADRSARAAEQERLRLARDVHDSIGHALALVSVQAQVAQQHLATDPEATSRALGHVVAATQTSLTELRRTLTNLRPGDEDGAGAPDLVVGIEHVVEAARDAGLTVDLAVDLGTVPPARPVAAAAFRIVQEAVTNVLRHAPGSHVRVEVGVRAGTLRIRVVDDGRGRALPPVPVAGGRGIPGMRDRALLAGGTLTVDLRDDGCTVGAALPVEGAP